MIVVVYYLNLCHVNCVSNNILLYEVIWLVINQIFFKMLPICLLCIWWCETIFNPQNAHLTQKKTSNENIKNTNSLVRSHTTKTTNCTKEISQAYIQQMEESKISHTTVEIKTKRINLHFNRVLIFSSKSNCTYRNQRDIKKNYYFGPSILIHSTFSSLIFRKYHLSSSTSIGHAS